MTQKIDDTDHEAKLHYKQLNGDLKGITFTMVAVHEQVVLMSSY